MKKTLSRILSATMVAGLLAGLPAAQVAAADHYPTRAINWVIPFGAGGGSDRLARLMAAEGPEHFGVELRVENRPGAGSVAGWQHVLNQPADGYTVFSATPTPMLTLLQEEGSAVGLNDIEIIGYISAFRSILVTRANEYPDWASFLAASRERPIVIGGTSALLMGVANILDQAGVSGVYVPYASTGEAVTDFLGGHIQAAALTESTAATIVPDRGIAIMNTSQLPLTPAADAAMGGNIPMAADFGFTGMAFPRWIGVHPQTPEPVMAKLDTMLGSLMQSEAVAQAFDGVGEEVIYLNRADAREDYTRLVEQMRNAIRLLD